VQAVEVIELRVVDGGRGWVEIVERELLDQVSMVKNSVRSS
jgi:hypothetical protein